MRIVLTAVVGFAVVSAGRCPAADSDAVKSISADSVVKWLEELGGKARTVNDDLVVWNWDGRDIGVGVFPNEPSLFLVRFFDTHLASDAQCNQWNRQVRFAAAVHPEKGKLALQACVLVADGLTVSGLKKHVKLFVAATGAFEKHLADQEKKAAGEAPDEKPAAVDADKVRAEMARLKGVAEDAEATAKEARRLANEYREEARRLDKEQLPGGASYRAEAARYASDAATEEATARDARRKISDLDGLLARTRK